MALHRKPENLSERFKLSALKVHPQKRYVHDFPHTGNPHISTKGKRIGQESCVGGVKLIGLSRGTSHCAYYSDLNEWATPAASS
jgi:hypothetical protein